MDQNYCLIKEVYHNAEMSKDVIGHLIKICDDANFRADLANEFAQYHEITREAKSICDEENIPVKTKKKAKSMIVSGISVNTLFDKTSTHLAEMMVQGSTMGIIDMKRALREYSGASDRVKGLADKLLHTEQNNVKSMLEYV